MMLRAAWGDFEPDRLNPLASAIAEPVATVTGLLLLLLFVKLLTSLFPALSSLLKASRGVGEALLVFGLPVYVGFWAYSAFGLGQPAASLDTRSFLSFLAGLAALLVTGSLWVLAAMVGVRSRSQRFIQEKSSTEESELEYHRERVRVSKLAFEKIQDFFSPVTILRKVRQALELTIPREWFPHAVRSDDGLYYSAHYGVVLTSIWILAGCTLIGISTLNTSMSEEKEWPIVAHEQTMSRFNVWSAESPFSEALVVFTVVDRDTSVPRFQDWAFCRYELEVSEDQAALLLDSMDYALDRFWVSSLISGVRGREVYVRSGGGETQKVKTAYNGGDGYVLTDGTAPLQDRKYLHPDCLKKG